MPTTWLRLALPCLVLLCAIATTSPASAQSTSEPVCAAEPVSARGEPSRFVWLAKTKARANWRSRVRATPDLGAAFATWSRAKEPKETCMSGPEGTVCIITAIPCRK